MLKEINSLQFGDFTLDRHARELRRLQTVLPITGKAFDLLVFMVENPGRPLSKSELLDAVWPETSVEESNLSQNVFLLRKVLGSSGDVPIKTLPGRGYQFTAQVTELAESATFDSYAGFPTRKGEAQSAVTLQATHTRTIVERDVQEHVFLNWRLLLITLLIVAAGVLGAVGAYRHFSASSSNQTASPAAASPLATRPAIAVLGFRNASSRPEDAWLSTAVAEMLASDVGAADKLRVIPNEQVSRAVTDLGLKAGRADSETARSGLHEATGADMLVEGSYVVVNHGSSPALRLMVQVQDAHSGKQLASFSETGEVGGLFTLVDRAGAELRRDLSDQGTDKDTGSALAGMSQSTEAMRFYAEAIDQARLFDSNSARGLFERAIQADPRFAMAHLGVADAWVDLGFMERAAKEAAEAFRLSTDLPREQRLAIEAKYRSLSHDSNAAINLYKALTMFYPDDEAWGMHLAVEQDGAGKKQDALDTLERLHRLSLTPAQRVEVNGHEAEEYAIMTTAEGQTKARNLVAEAVTIAEKQPGLLVRGEALRSQCFILSSIGPIANARSVCEQAKATYQSVGNLQAVASAVNNLAGIASSQNDWKLAETDYAEARKIFHDLGNSGDEYSAIYNLGLTHLQMGELESAIQDCTLLSKAHDTGNDDFSVFYGNLYAGTAEMHEGKLREAQAVGRAALRKAEEERTEKMDFAPFNHALADELLADISLEAGELEQAHKAFDDAAAVLKPTNHEIANAELVTAESELVVEEGHPTKAAFDALSAAATILDKDRQEVDNQMKARILLAQMDIETGATHNAAVTLSEAQALDGKGSWEDSHLQLLLANADLQRTLGHPGAAVKTLQEEISEAAAGKYAYLGLKGEVALEELTHETTPSPENTVRLQALGRQAEHAGFKGLARRAISPPA